MFTLLVTCSSMLTSHYTEMLQFFTCTELFSRWRCKCCWSCGKAQTWHIFIPKMFNTRPEWLRQIQFIIFKVPKLVKKVKFTLEQAMKAQSGSRGIALHLALVGVGGQHHAPAAFPPGKTWYPFCRRLGGPQGWSGRVQKISCPTVILSQDCLACSELRHQLHISDPHQNWYNNEITWDTYRNMYSG